MAIYYYNGDEILVPFSIISNKPVFASDTVSLKHFRLQQSAQRWELNFSTLSKENSANSLLGVLEDMENRNTMIMPQLPEVNKRMTLTGGIILQSTVNANSESIILPTDNASGLLPKGSFIKFSNHDKVYITKNDLDFSTASPTLQLEIYPKLVNNVTAGSSLNFGSNCIISYYRDINNTQGITFSDGVLSNQGTVTLIEAL